MKKKQQQRRPADNYRLPPRAERARQAAARVAQFKPRPPLPGLRVIWACIGLCASFVGMALFFWLPSRSLVEDLRSHGVTVAATVIDVDTKPKYVKIRLVQGPEKGTAVELSEIAGMLPDAHTGDSMLVTYDPKDPSRILARSWVTAPPADLPTYGTAALAAFFLSGSVALTLRRRWILRTWPPDSLVPDPAQPQEPGSKSVRLTKP
ncbi:hypothetical protein MQE23_18915 [Streptomyces sp. HP-A2021]|uniref:hypothetical protein n=1 Tax=Streptomyces sp. HP-A2021 TaxID=2927875 RepID=UPI001FB02A06|nr:hypothetical protein [Streptomyces sp. HP-A2021]UOB11015.1 hypothetical protein MQE23_18915 [Streptomyces sp. HP-A2021]